MIEFEEGVTSSESWFRQSWEMYEASKALYGVLAGDDHTQSEGDNHRQVGALKDTMLLLGLSAENALKGAFVYRSKPEISKGRLKPTHFHDVAHDLSDIARKLGLELSETHMALLQRLTIFVQWASKYQTALRKTDHDRAAGKIKLVYPSDFDLVEKLISDLQSRSGYAEGSGWPYRN